MLERLQGGGLLLSPSPFAIHIRVHKSPSLGANYLVKSVRFPRVYCIGSLSALIWVLKSTKYLIIWLPNQITVYKETSEIKDDVQKSGTFSHGVKAPVFQSPTMPNVLVH